MQGHPGGPTIESLQARVEELEAEHREMRREVRRRTTEGLRIEVSAAELAEADEMKRLEIERLRGENEAQRVEIERLRVQRVLPEDIRERVSQAEAGLENARAELSRAESYSTYYKNEMFSLVGENDEMKVMIRDLRKNSKDNQRIIAKLNRKINEKDSMIRKLRRCYKRVKSLVLLQQRWIRQMYRAIMNITSEAKRVIRTTIPYAQRIKNYLQAFFTKVQTTQRYYRGRHLVGPQFTDADANYPPQLGTASDDDMDEGETEEFSSDETDVEEPREVV